MVLDFVAALCYIGIVWCLGQWTAGGLFADDRKRACLLSFALGFSELTLLSTFLYFTCRMPTQAIRVVWLLLGIVSFVDLIRRRGVDKEAAAVLFGVAGLWLLMLYPGLVGKDQYYVYRGNCTDQQTYVEETAALSMHPIGWYEERSREEIELVSDVLWRGYQWAVEDRPSAGMMIAVMRANPSGEIYWVVYLYRMFVLAMVMASLLYLFATVLEGVADGGFFQKTVWVLAAVLYPIGFWGQIQYDIDAVSQISSIAVLTALTAVFLQYAQNLVEGGKDVWNRGRYAAMILLASAGLALYLESALVHGALYLVSGILLLACERIKNRTLGKAMSGVDGCGECEENRRAGDVKGVLTGRQVAQLAGIPLFSLGILILVNYRIVHFLRAQIHTSVSDVRQSWANYFNAWWMGRHGIDEGRITGPVSSLVNRVISTSGMYNMTANYERYYGVAALILTGLDILLAVLIIFCMLRPFVKKMERPLWLLWVVVMTGVMAVLGMCIGSKEWSAGKLLYYISTYLYAFLCIPALRVRNCRGMAEKLALVLAVLLFVSNARMVVSRCRDVKVNIAGLGYRGNYPSDMIPGLKMKTDFNFDTNRLAGYDGVRIGDLSKISDNQFYLQYLKVKLTCVGLVWIPEYDINYYQESVETSQYRTLTGNIAVLEVLENEEGRFEIVIDFVK